MSLNLTLWPPWPLSQQVSWWSGVNHDVDVCVSEEQVWLQVCLLCSCLSAGPCRSEGAADGSWKQCRPNESRESEVTSTDAAEFTASWRCSAWNQHDNLTIRRVIEESHGGEGDGGGGKVKPLQPYFSSWHSVWLRCSHFLSHTGPDRGTGTGASFTCSSCLWLWRWFSLFFFFFFTPVWENSCPLQPQHWVNINNKYG